MSSSSSTYQHVYRRLSASARRVSSRLQHWMEHHPVASNSLLCLNLWVAGDALAQYSEFRHHHNRTSKDHDDESFLSHYDMRRTAQCAGFGACFTGPLIAVWYPYLDRVAIHYRMAARYGVWGPPVMKVVADEFLMDPPCIVAFFGYMAAWEHHHDASSSSSWQDLFQAKLRDQFVPSWVTSLIAWPPILLGTFRYLPVFAQAPVINVCCIAWDAFLSHRNRLSEEDHEQHNNDNSHNDNQHHSKKEQEKTEK
ncbi:MpV17 mitochondrial inner membrane protein [Seminavis robusta]|uniref:MpV17 mitochondrial inner membrane protein n=1 Tax=Seminavis robusta TaxID=568900 RepID=A0A9N8EQW1_9STRA|nr:MpV17 mitochondrial inner membrane protein [Seminavis robusta]|eukprot:Sro1420_g271140.1 MpV17 mitochondrial inner membrane protein (253) ;mRNA; r:17848-18606